VYSCPKAVYGGGDEDDVTVEAQCEMNESSEPEVVVDKKRDDRRKERHEDGMPQAGRSMLSKLVFCG
jgi:hypothetical protein